MTPVAASERITSLDYVRGVAVLGILAANVILFGQPSGASMWPGAFLTAHDALADWLWVAQFVAVDGKFRGLFTLLFGAGMVLFAERAEERGQAGDGLQARRLLLLLLFGLAHFYLLWRGDILTLYALLGAVALPFLNLSAAGQLRLGLAGYLLGAVLYAGAYGMPLLLGDALPAADVAGLEVAMAAELADDAVDARILTSGSYGQFVAHNLSGHFWTPLYVALFSLLETLPLMLIGMGLYRIGLFSGGIDPVRQRRWGWALLLPGAGLSLALALWATADGLSFGGTMAAFLGLSPAPRLLMILGLAALLALHGARADGWLAGRLVAAGRMAFSNYIGTTLLMMALFHPWAGGLFGELTRPELYLAMVLGWAAMLGWSQPWLARFRHGPLEWLWRCLTYGHRFPLRR